MENNFIPKASDIMKQAVEADNKAESDPANRIAHLTKALGLYKLGIEYFMTGSKYMKNEKAKAAVKEKIMQYMKRAEEVKEAIAKGDSKKVAVTAGAAGPKGKAAGTAKKSGKDDEPEDEKDPETAKLHAALESAIVT